MNMYMHWFVLYHVRWICLGSFASPKCSARREVSDKPDIIDRYYLRVQICSFYCGYSNVIPIIFISCSSSLLWENFKHILLLTVSEEMSKSERKEKETEREIENERRANGREEERLEQPAKVEIKSCAVHALIFTRIYTQEHWPLGRCFFFSFWNW